MLQIKKPKEFAEEFERIYLGRGFGTMNKNELEVLFFHLLRQFGDIAGKSNFDLAIELRIPEAKIKRLSYEADLLYNTQSDDVQKTRFLALLSNAKIQKENGTLRFVVEDKYLRSVIYEDLKKNGYYLDTSFNSEIVSIHKEALISLLDSYYDEDSKKQIVDEYKRAIKKVNSANRNKIVFKDVMKTIFDKLIEKGVDCVIDGAGDYNYSTLIQLISEGLKSVGKIVALIAKMAIIFA